MTSGTTSATTTTSSAATGDIRSDLADHVNITPLLPPIYIKLADWQKFVDGLARSNQTLQEYAQEAARQEIENAVYHDPRLLAPATGEPAKVISANKKSEDNNKDKDNSGKLVKIAALSLTTMSVAIAII